MVKEDSGTDGKVSRLDCGFSVWVVDPLSHRQRNRFSSGALVSCSKSARGYTLKRVTNSSQDRFLYKAVVQGIEDAETIVAAVDLGFGRIMVERFKLRGLVAPARDSEGGAFAKRYIESRLCKGHNIVLRSYKTCCGDSYLADIAYLRPGSLFVTILQKGTFLNQELVDAGLVAQFHTPVSELDDGGVAGLGLGARWV